MPSCPLSHPSKDYPFATFGLNFNELDLLPGYLQITVLFLQRNVNLDRILLLGRIPVGVKIKVYNVFYTLIPSFIPDISLAKCFHVKIAH